MITSLRRFFDLLLSFVVHIVELNFTVVTDLVPSICLILATSRLLHVLFILVDSLHQNIFTLWVDPVVSDDVPLESDAENPPLHNTCSFSVKLYTLLGWEFSRGQIAKSRVRTDFSILHFSTTSFGLIATRLTFCSRRG